MKRFILCAAFILPLALGIGCATPAMAPLPSVSESEGSVMDSSVSGANQRKSIPAAQPTAASMSSAANQAQAAEPRMIVYTGALSLQVNDTADTINKIDAILKNADGYIASKSVVAFGKDKLRGTIQARIPALALEATLAQIKALSVKVLKETADSNDVTAEYVDLDARRKNLEAYEIELQKLLETVRERTGKAEDILAVYNQLTEVRGQIEQIKGRQKYLENTSAMATYTIELVPIEEVVVEGTPGWNPGRVFAESLDSLVGALQSLVNLLIRFIVVILPLLLLCLVPLAILVLLARRFIKRRQTKTITPAT